MPFFYSEVMAMSPSPRKSKSCEISSTRKGTSSFQNVILVYDDGLQHMGALAIVISEDGKSIEWRPTDESVCDDDDEYEQEWRTVIKRDRVRSTSGCDSTSSKIQTINIPVTDLKGYKVSTKNKLTIILKGGRKTDLIFPNDDAERFTEVLNNIIKTKRSGSGTFLVSRENTSSPQSFSDLILVDDPRENIWSFFSHLKNHPYDTTMSTFSKLSDILHEPGYEDLRFVMNSESGLKWEHISGIEHEKTPVHTPRKKTVQYNSKHGACAYIDYDLDTSLSQMEIRSDEGLDSSCISSTGGAPLRQILPRGPPLEAQTWCDAIDSEGRISDPEAIKNIIFHGIFGWVGTGQWVNFRSGKCQHWPGGICKHLREEVWKFLLGSYPWNSTLEERVVMREARAEEYWRMKVQWETISPGQEARFNSFQTKKSLVEKDVIRTDRHWSFFKGEDNPNLNLLMNVLMTYVMYNFDLGYVQGMSDLLSPLLLVMKNEVDAFWCFVGFMDIVYRNFDFDQCGIKKQMSQLNTLVTAVVPDLAKHLKQKEADSMIICFRWLLVWFKREFSLADVMTLWEVLWTGLPCPNFHLLIAVAILEKEKDKIIKGDYDLTQTIRHLNDLNDQMDVNEILSRACAIFKQLKDTEVLTASTKNILGLSPSTSVQKDLKSALEDGKSSKQDSSSSETTTDEDGFEQGLHNNFF